MSFNVAKEIDDFFYFQFIIIFLIGFSINVYTNGQATVIFLEDYYSISNASLLTTLNDDGYFTMDDNAKITYLKDMYQTTIWRSEIALYVSTFMYFILSPAVSFYYTFFVFPKRKRKI
jgi:hypothetical protein